MLLEELLWELRVNDMIKLKVKGNFSKTEKYLKKIKGTISKELLKECGVRGVEALRNATPIDSGNTAKSWDYNIYETDKNVIIEWTNSNTVNGVNIAILLQYDHATGNGGFVKGRDYINPAIKPVFNEILETIRKGVSG